MDVIINIGRDIKGSDIDKAKVVIEKIASNLKPVPHWADSIFEEYVTRY
jgi:hypothetical protein